MAAFRRALCGGRRRERTLAGRAQRWTSPLAFGALIGWLVLAVLAPPPGHAQEAGAQLQAAAVTPPAAEAVPDFLKPIPEWDSVLDRVELLLREPSVSDKTLGEARKEIIQVEREIKSHLSTLRPRLASVRAQVERLGPAPAAGHVPEPSTVAQQRSALATEVTNLSSAMNAAEASLLRGQNLAERIRDTRRRTFQENVLQRGPSVLSPELWGQIADDIPAGFHRLGTILSDWETVPEPSRYLRLIALAILLAVGLGYVAMRGVSRYREWNEPGAPPEWRRAASAGWVIVLRAMPPLAVIALLMTGITVWYPLPPRLLALGQETLLAIAAAVTVHAVTRTVLALQRPHWRLLQLTDEAAFKLYTRVLLLAVVYALDRIASALSEAANTPYSLNVAQSFASSVAFAGLIISILMIKAPDFNARRGVRRIGPIYFRAPLWLVAIAIVVAAVIGYVALARFIAGQLIVISTILIVTYLFLVWANAFGRSFSDDRTSFALWLRGRLGLEKRRREQVALPITLLLQAAIIVAAIPVILLQWGFDWQDVVDLFRAALFGRLGSAQISVLTLLAALLVFMVGYIGAKIFQGWLDDRVLAPAGVEDSVRHSIRTAIGYLGIAIAAVVALSYAGLDISNIAIVAGALSVGIGFGLQSIVNNFVSGLILLAERPIKVGDWVIVGGDEGIVRRISVRATELETFDRSNVIVPNAMLVTEKVKNWTLHNQTGRYIVKVSVHYDSDPEQVRDILLGVARAHPQILSTPEPFVYFEDFGSHSLDFSLYIYLANVSRSFAVRTDLRIAILKAFRAAGVEMPYPQVDIHFRDLGWVKGAIAERMARSSTESTPIHDFKAESGLADHEPEHDLDSEDGNGNGNGNGHST